MKLTTKQLPNSTISLSITAETKDLLSLKNHVLGHFVGRVKLPGFRQGKAPLSLVEKQVDPTELQNEFLEEAINHLYQKAVENAKQRPIDQPEIAIKKFVPFTTLEFEAKVVVVGKIVLADYKNLKIAKPQVNVSDKDVKAVIESLQTRLADKKGVSRPAKKGDELTIDFKGVDTKDQPIAGADGKDYPLTLGSKSFIPGFEDNLVGVKTGDTKTFKIKFPSDYGVKSLSSKTVKFTVVVNKVQELELSKLDNQFAAKAGPFKSIKELSDDIHRNLVQERQNEADRNYEGELVKQISDKSQVTVPAKLVDEQVDRTIDELKRDIVYRGQTYQEYLDQEGINEAENRKRLVPGATERVKAGLVLSEISEKEGLTVTVQELDDRMQDLKSQYKDEQMQAELNKPEARRDIASRMLTEKTLDLIVKLNG